MSRIKTPVERIVTRLVEDENGCWNFTGALNVGYGYVGGGGRGVSNVYAHRAMYEYFIADIPAGLDVDHLCHNRACCNPWHLEPVTRRVNANRGKRHRAEIRVVRGRAGETETAA